MSTGVEGFILGFALTFIGSNQPISQQPMYFDAARAAGTSGYIQSGLKDQVDTSLKYMERRYVPEPVLKYGSATVFIGRTVIEQRLVLNFTF